MCGIMFRIATGECTKSMIVNILRNTALAWLRAGASRQTGKQKRLELLTTLGQTNGKFVQEW